MVNNIKIELFENVNILSKIAKKGSPTFPDQLCRFLNNEFNFKFTAVAEGKGQNSFAVIGKSFEGDISFLSNLFTIEDYDTVIDSIKYENDLISECKIKVGQSHNNLQSIAMFIGDTLKYVLLIEHKIVPSDSEKAKYFTISKFVQNLLNMWNNSPQSQQANTNIKSLELLNKSTKGLVKEIKTVNGLLTLIKEEQVPNSVNKYLDEIKSTNHYLLESINDLSVLLNLEEPQSARTESQFKLDSILDYVIGRIGIDYPKANIQNKNPVSEEITFDKNHLEFIIFNALNFIAVSSKSNQIVLDTKLTSDNKLRINLNTESVNLGYEKLIKLTEPFENRELSKNQSGLTLTLLAKYVDLLNGSIKFNEQKNNFSLNISIPIIKSSAESILEGSPIDQDSKKDKILVIESDNSSSTLLNNYLSKWHYKTDIVSSGDLALQLIKENRYVAVILNIEQENENSLELLQKIKNNKSTRNTPVIVFSVEAEKDKIFLMGSVDYLVKPINYNKLVEILTSYKLRRNSTVLCVDDDQPTLNLVKQAIHTAGFNVVSEHRPELVNDLISEKELDLAIIDLDMPKLNGIELIKQIKSHDKFSKLPIIIYTGKEDYQEDLQKIDGMFVDLLDKKSTSFNELENTILEMIKSYEETSTIEESVNQSSGPKILMAEDYKHSQIIVTRLLKKSGFENIIVVENGEEALNICENDKIDLVLMDMQMPVMNGFEATGKIRELEGYADTPIIALTAFAMKGDREKCLEAGATDYIPKPLDSKEFIEKVKYYTQVSVVS
jgi:CheY-like chemotaxis protein